MGKQRPRQFLYVMFFVNKIVCVPNDDQYSKQVLLTTDYPGDVGHLEYPRESGDLSNIKSLT